MNSILQLKGRFEQRGNQSLVGNPKLPKGKMVTAAHLRRLATQLQGILNYWQQHTEIAGALVSVHYKQIIAKSNRLKALLSENSQSPTKSIRGSKFVWEYNEDGKQVQKHVFTHYIPLIAITKSILLLNNVADVIDLGYSGRITCEDTENIADKNIYPYQDTVKRSAFLKVVIDGYYVERFDIDMADNTMAEESIITIFKTNIETKALMSRFGIDIVEDRVEGTTLRLYKEEVETLIEKAPYLISMSVTDFSQITRDDIPAESEDQPEEYSLIPSPANEPVVGVIDTQFDERVYFSPWVEYINMVDPNIDLKEKDFYHGTAVSSIIVNGPLGNPELEDGCGHFKVRHFGVATDGNFSSFAVLRMIRSIVSNNRDIKVWNLSLGSQKEIKDSFISPEAAELDRIQSEYDVVFVVAGTNLPDGETETTMKIGAPADSLNSLVVNSVAFNKNSASYTRKGPVLSFFNKPDISYYGGDGVLKEEKIAVCKDSLGATYVKGTSFAAPWITRKMAYLIHVMGLSREIAKALIIDAAAGWERQDNCSHTKGYGVVPTHINDIIHTSDDEIRFIITGNANEYETYTYNLPVPVVNGAHPFYARATLVYFPHCDRNQGVDYTNTEMDIHFGRFHIVKGKAKIESLDQNCQSDEGLVVMYEEDARKLYRKWDNVKHISEIIKSRAIPRKAYEGGLWGLSIKTKERLQPRRNEGLPFGVVVTLKEMNGVNRIDDFMTLCMARGWLVNKLDVETQVDVYLTAEEELPLE